MKAVPRPEGRPRRTIAEALPRLLLCSVLYHRTLELGQPLSDSPPELGLGEGGREALLNAVARYVRARELDLARPGDPRSTLLADIAAFTAEVERPGTVFVSGAKETALEVASRLLRYEGWAPASTSSEWRQHAAAVDPASPNAAEEYVNLFHRYWEWAGSPESVRGEDDQLVHEFPIPESYLNGLWKDRP